jgi:hypothetical protein
VATIGWIKIGVATDTSKFTKGLQSSRKQLDEWGKKLQAVVAGYVGFQAVKGMVETVKSTIDAVSATGILAQRVGMASEALSKLSYAARYVNISQEDLVSGMEKMNEKLGEAAMTASGPTYDALKRLGLSAGVLARMGTEKAFYKIIDALDGVHNAASRARLIEDIFGKGGQGINNLVAQGSAAIRAAADEGIRFGTVLNSFDTAKIQEVNASMIRLSAANEGFYNLLVAKLSPFITELIDRYIEWGYQGTKSASFIAQGTEWVVAGLGRVLDIVNVVQGGFNLAASAASQYIAGQLHFAEALLAGLQVVERFAASVVKTWLRVFETISGYADVLADKIGGIAVGLGKTAMQLAGIKSRFGDTPRDFKTGFTDALHDAAAGVDQLAEGHFVGLQKSLQTTLHSMAGDLEALSKNQFAKAGDALNKMGEGDKTVRKLVDDIQNSAAARAANKVAKDNAFAGAGQMPLTKLEPPKFAGAAELGSKEAYSAILKARGVFSGQNEQRRTAESTRQTAEGVNRSNALLEKIAQQATANLPGNLAASF